jgi:hypothetical protein
VDVITRDGTGALGLEERLTRVLRQLLNHHNPKRHAEEDPDR